MASTHVVVDGSNLATEGRTLPSLSQLEEAVAAYQAGSSDWLLPGYLGELANIARFLLFRRRWVARKVGSRRPAPCARGGPPVLSSARRPQP